MRIPASPKFTKFVNDCSNKVQGLILEEFIVFLESIEEVLTIEVSDGSATHPVLGSSPIKCLSVKKSFGIDYWDLLFIDTTFPHVEIAMWEQTPKPKSYYSLAHKYTQLLLDSSFVDLADGTGVKSRKFSIIPRNTFAIRGRQEWIYLYLKIQSINYLSNLLLLRSHPKLPLLEFASILKTEFYDESIPLIELYYGNETKDYLKATDQLLLTSIGINQLTNLVESLECSLQDWMESIDPN